MNLTVHSKDKINTVRLRVNHRKYADLNCECERKRIFSFLTGLDAEFRSYFSLEISEQLKNLQKKNKIPKETKENERPNLDRDCIDLAVTIRSHGVKGSVELQTT